MASQLTLPTHVPHNILHPTCVANGEARIYSTEDVRLLPAFLFVHLVSSDGGIYEIAGELPSLSAARHERSCH